MSRAMSQEQKFEMMTEAPIPGLIGRLAVPTIISMLITSFYNMADTFFVGKIGTSATAAVGVVFPVMAIIQALGFFCGHGSGNSISRHLGSKDIQSARELAATGFFLAFALGILLMVLGLIFLDPLSHLLGSTETIFPYTRDYLRFILLGAPLRALDTVPFVTPSRRAISWIVVMLSSPLHTGCCYGLIILQKTTKMQYRIDEHLEMYYYNLYRNLTKHFRALKGGARNEMDLWETGLENSGAGNGELLASY